MAHTQMPAFFNSILVIANFMILIVIQLSNKHIYEHQ